MLTYESKPEVKNMVIKNPFYMTIILDFGFDSYNKIAYHVCIEINEHAPLQERYSEKKLL